MTVLSILFSQKNVIIGAKTGKQGKGSIVDDLKDSLVRTFDASTRKGIVVDATVNEEHLTTVDVTENPVEDGATITDHVQLKPTQLTVEGVISDSPLGYAIIGNIQNIVRSVSTLFGNKSRSLDAYNDLLELQKSRQPFTVITGLKRYDNMIMTELSVPRTSQTGQAIHFRATMREIKIVSSKVSSQAVVNKTAPGSKDLASPTSDKGQKVTETQPVNQKTERISSTLFDIFGT